MSNIEDYYPPPPRPRPLPALLYLLPLLLIMIVVGAGLFWWIERFSGKNSGLEPNAQPRQVAFRGDLVPEEKLNIKIYKDNGPCVVHVTNLAERRSFMDLNVQEIPRGTGSGFIWDQAGHIVTNYHVVEGADAAQVILADHSTYEAKQIWAYQDKDIAVLWINAPKEKLHPLPIGTSHDLQVGQITYAIGNPFGLDQTLTTGIVSALGREIQSANNRPIRGVIQTSAAINPGNSGGPLLDSDGRLIGMNTAILSPSGTFAGIGFAIPVDEINQIVPQLISHGKVVRPRLGVQVAEDQVAQQLGVEHGAVILKVVPNSPAAKAGLQATRKDENGQIQLGDVVLALNNQPINNGQELIAGLEQFKVGDSLTLTVQRGEERLNIKVTLEAGQ